MSKRPLCQLLLAIAIGIGLCKYFGMSFLWSSPAGTLPFLWAKEEQCVTVSGIVYGQEEQTFQNQTYTYIYLKQANLFIRSKKYPIRNIKCTLEGSVECLLDYEVTLTGDLCFPLKNTNPGEFSQQLWEASRKIDFYLKNITEWNVISRSQGFSGIVSRITQQGKELLFKIFPEKQAAILQAMIFGEKTELEDETKNQFQSAGISHVIAISGLHMSLIGMGVWNICKWMGAPIVLAISGSVGILAAYGILLGNPTTAFRALLMFGIMMGAKLFGRSYDLLSSLAAAGIVLLLDNPDLLVNSGFQLSFSAVLGMGGYCRLEEEVFRNTWKTEGKWWSALRSGISLWFFSLPIVLYSFYQVSVLGILVNLLVIPLMPVILGSGILAILVGFFGIMPGSIVGIPAYYLLKGCGILGELAEKCSFGMWTPGKPQIWQMLLYYMVLLGVTYGLKYAGKIFEKRKKLKQKIWFGTELGVKIALLLIISIPWRIPQKACVLDVGQGDGIVLQSDGKCILVDGGSSSRKEVGKNVVIPYLKQEGIAYLDMILVTHSDEDHINGIYEVLEESQKGWFQVESIGMPWWMQRTEEGEILAHLAQRSGTEVIYLTKGDVITLGKTNLHILHPGKYDYSEDTNGGSLVFTWETKIGEALFTGDLPEEQENGILNKLGRCAFLKVSHHGSNYATTDELLKIIKPQMALISCGKRNRYGHPGEELLKRLETFGCEIYRTDLQGALTIDLDKGILRTMED